MDQPQSAAAREPALSRLGLGCARIGSFNNPQSLEESCRLVQAAIAGGVTTIDTSNIYGQGDSERQIGRAIAGRRASVFLVTKTGLGFSPKMRLLRLAKPLLRPLLRARAGKSASPSAVTRRREDHMRADFRPETFGDNLDRSLKRLRTPVVDGFLLHSPPADVVRQKAVAGALAALKGAGRVRHFGVSCDDLACLEAAVEMPGLTLLQLPWELIVAAGEGAIGEAIRRRGILVLAREVIRSQPGLPPAEAIAHAAAHPLVASVLVGTTSPDHLAALVASVDGNAR